MQRSVIYTGQTNMKHLSYIIFLLFMLGSCSYPCGKSDGFKINFISYTEQEVSTYTVKRYSKGSNFSNLIDSTIIDSWIISYRQSNDTLQWISSSSIANLTSDFDYLILIPATGNQYQITEVFEPQQEGRKSSNKIYCVNGIESCLVNGSKATLDFNNLYLKK